MREIFFECYNCLKPLKATCPVPVAPFAPIELPRFEVDHRAGDRKRTMKLNTLFLLMAESHIAGGQAADQVGYVSNFPLS